MTEGVTPVLVDDFERLYVRPKPGRTLVVGSRVYKTREDRRKRYADAIGVDMVAGEGVDWVCDLENGPKGSPIDSPQFRHWITGRFSHADCISVLEHSKEPKLLARNLQDLLCPGGTLFLTVPFVWRVHSYPDDYWRFTPSGVRLLFPRIKWHHLFLSHGWMKPEGEKLPQVIHESQLYFARTEVYGFGSLAG